MDIYHSMVLYIDLYAVSTERRYPDATFHSYRSVIVYFTDTVYILASPLTQPPINLQLH